MTSWKVFDSNSGVVSGVLMCSKCKSQYGRGGWDKDKEGNDEFCR